MFFWFVLIFFNEILYAISTNYCKFWQYVTIILFIITICLFSLINAFLFPFMSILFLKLFPKGCTTHLIIVISRTVFVY